MKHIVMALFLLFGLVTFGQQEHRGPRHDKDASLTPEQHAELRTKKLTLALDLNADQREKVQELFLAQAEARQERMKRDTLPRDPERRYERMNKKLDAMIAHKEEMKEILSEEQFEEWEKLAHKKGRHGHGHGHKGPKGPRGRKGGGPSQKGK